MTKKNLHSNMVRFIMKKRVFNLMYNEEIYIPIWLDLLYPIEAYLSAKQSHLHSNMVRFIMEKKMAKWKYYGKFTFQYG